MSHLPIPDTQPLPNPWAEAEKKQQSLYDEMYAKHLLQQYFKDLDDKVVEQIHSNPSFARKVWNSIKGASYILKNEFWNYYFNYDKYIAYKINMQLIKNVSTREAQND